MLNEQLRYEYIVSLIDSMEVLMFWFLSGGARKEYNYEAGKSATEMLDKNKNKSTKLKLL